MLRVYAPRVGVYDVEDLNDWMVRGLPGTGLVAPAPELSGILSKSIRAFRGRYRDRFE